LGVTGARLSLRFFPSTGHLGPTAGHSHLKTRASAARRPSHQS
jgi:hypothetical protein